MQKSVFPTDLNDPTFKHFFKDIPLSEKDMNVGDVISSNFGVGEELKIKKISEKKSFDGCSAIQYAVSFNDFKTQLISNSKLVNILTQHLRLRNLCPIVIQKLQSPLFLKKDTPPLSGVDLKLDLVRQDSHVQASFPLEVVEQRLEPVPVCYDESSVSVRYHEYQISASEKESQIQKERFDIPISVYMQRFSQNMEPSTSKQPSRYLSGQCIVICLKTFLQQFVNEANYKGKFLDILSNEDLRHFVPFNNHVLPNCSGLDSDYLENELFTWISRVSSFLTDLIGSNCLVPTYVMSGSKTLIFVVLRKFLLKVGLFISEEDISAGFNIKDFEDIRDSETFLKKLKLPEDIQKLLKKEISLVTEISKSESLTEEQKTSLALLFRVYVGDDHWKRIERFYEVIISRERLKLLKVEAQDLYVYAL